MKGKKRKRPLVVEVQKYAALQVTAGPVAALRHLLNDLGSKGILTIDPIGTSGLFSATVPDIWAVSRKAGRKPFFEPVYGAGRNNLEAIDRLFKILINPSLLVPEADGFKDGKLYLMLGDEEGHKANPRWRRDIFMKPAPRH